MGRLTDDFHLEHGFKVGLEVGYPRLEIGDPRIKALNNPREINKTLLNGARVPPMGGLFVLNFLQDVQGQICDLGRYA